MDPSAPFADKLAIVTGAASGIGRATAVRLAAKGATLVLSDLNKQGLHQTAALCLAAFEEQPEPLLLSMDVGNAGQVRAFMDEVVDTFGSGCIDFVFNCAGVNPQKCSIENVSDDYYDKLMDASLRGTFLMMRACIPHLHAGSSLVNVSSIVGLRPRAGMAVYAAAKAGIVAMTKAAALEQGPKGIRCNVIAPGEIHTPTNYNVVVGGAALRKAHASVALGRMGTAEEVADVVLFLFSKESHYVNGTLVEINGGME